MKKKQKEAQRNQKRKPGFRKKKPKTVLSIREKSRLAELMRLLSGNPRTKKIPTTAQKSITFEKMYQDGICQVKHNYFTKMVEFYDINYELLEIDDQGYILEEYSKFINYFDPAIKFELFLFGRQVNERVLADQFDIPLQQDIFDDMLCSDIVAAGEFSKQIGAARGAIPSKAVVDAPSSAI